MFLKKGTWPMVIYKKGTRPKPGDQEGLSRESGTYIKH